MSLSLFDIIKEAILPGTPKILEQTKKFVENEQEMHNYLRELEQSATRLVMLTTDDVAKFHIGRGVSTTHGEGKRHVESSND